MMIVSGHATSHFGRAISGIWTLSEPTSQLPSALTLTGSTLRQRLVASKDPIVKHGAPPLITGATIDMDRTELVELIEQALKNSAGEPGLAGRIADCVMEKYILIHQSHPQPVSK